MKVAAVVALKADHRLPLLLEISGLARSTFFYHQARLDRPDPQADLKAAIRDEFTRAKGRYGHRRIRRELTKGGWTVAKKTVWKLMGELGLHCHVRRKRRWRSYRGQVGTVAPNILNRHFDAERPNQKWVTDVTEFAIGDDKIYLSPVMDLYDRQIIAYAWGRSPTLTLTNSSLARAIATLGPGEEPLVHSDQGFHYQHRSWQDMLASVGATQSMSRKGNCLDNAIIEAFFGHLKEELFHHTTFLSVEAFTTALDDYIDWYNHERTSERLEGLSPVQYRTQTLAA